jgi:hypothetical protein
VADHDTVRVEEVHDAAVGAQIVQPEQTWASATVACKEARASTARLVGLSLAARQYLVA